jgi:TatD DNase family protein
MGCFFSINPMMLRSDISRKTLKILPLDRLLTETDGPFTEKSPGTRFLPWDLGRTLLDMSEIFEITPEAMQQQIAANLATVEAVLHQKPCGPRAEKAETG